MYKDVLQHANLVHWAEYGLVIFFVVFIVTTIWVYTRSRRDVDHWSKLPLNDEPPAHDASSKEADDV